MEPAVKAPRSRALCTTFAGTGFLLMIIGITYFAMLAISVRFGGDQGERAASYVELGRFLTGEMEWYKDARIYGAVSLMAALTSLLFGVSPLARITIPVAGTCYVLLVFFGHQIAKLIEGWASLG
ncbi:MAG TPA: hypothetical protein VFY93_00890 [Planctomycetota bacterium]|nr:hypothetical protein [Planctomycetota bacterium]